MSTSEKKSRFSEGEDVDVPKYLRDHGNPEAAEEWEKYDGRVEEISEKKLAQALARVALQNPEYTRKVAALLSVGGVPKKAKPWSKLPKGWTEESVKAMWRSLTGDEKHKVTACMKKMEGKIDDPGAFCASLRDHIEGDTSWRGEDR